MAIPCNFPSSSAAFTKAKKPSTHVRNRYWYNGSPCLKPLGGGWNFSIKLPITFTQYENIVTHFIIRSIHLAETPTIFLIISFRNPETCCTTPTHAIVSLNTKPKLGYLLTITRHPHTRAHPPCVRTCLFAPSNGTSTHLTSMIILNMFLKRIKREDMFL